MLRLEMGLAGVLLAACSGSGFISELKGEAVIGSGTGMLAALPPLTSLSSVDFDLNSDFKQQMVTREKITLARVDGASVKVTTSGQDVTFLDELELVARTGTDETLFARAENISMLAGKSEVTLKIISGSNDITPQVKTSPMSIVMRGKGTKPTTDTKLEVTVVLFVDAR